MVPAVACRIPRARMLNFSTWMVVKIFFHNYPIPFILTGMAFLLSFTSYGMYIYERYSPSLQ